MQVVFRVDASVEMGIGHVMRCLTLADALALQGAKCHFICREHVGHLADYIYSRGHEFSLLPTLADEASDTFAIDEQPLAHAHWLGSTWQQDAHTCEIILARLQPDWLVVDHYALDYRWEVALKFRYRKLMVIDDLADREHACDLLLDQTFGCYESTYQMIVPTACILLCGARYSLLRPEFSRLRQYSLMRRINPKLQQLIISMGGVDKDNVTSKVLRALMFCALPDDCKIIVVMGKTAIWLAEVRQLVEQMPWPTELLVGIDNMARHMSDSDLAIGGAGSTAWERCCLGLPSIMIILAENQRNGCNSLLSAGAGWVLEENESLPNRLKKMIDTIVHRKEELITTSRCASEITDGEGVDIVCKYIFNK